MEIRKTNLGVEYELELSEVGTTSVKVIATFPNVESEWKEFEIKGLFRETVKLIEKANELKYTTPQEEQPIEQYINEQAIMYVSMELAKLMGEGKVKSFTLQSSGCILVSISNGNKITQAIGLQQIEELIKQIRYGI